MLTSLTIKNVVLIDVLSLDFDAGLTVLTGETGAGKSILLDSLALALGERGDVALVRHGQNEAAVTACFSVSDKHPARALLRANGMEEVGDIILRRAIGRDGRSKAFVNDAPVSVGFLKTLGDCLAEIHGQFSSHALMNPGTHLGVLDMYGGLEKQAAACARQFQEWQDKKAALAAAAAAFDQSKQEEELLRGTIADLEKLKPQKGEEELLAAKRAALMNGEKILESLAAAAALLGDESGVAANTTRALTQLERVAGLMPDPLKGLALLLENAAENLNDALAGIDKVRAEMGDIEELPVIDERLFALRDMARRHKTTIDLLPELLEALRQKVALLDSEDDTLKALADAAADAKEKYETAARALSAARRLAGEKLTAAVMRELPDLKLASARFVCDVADADEAGWQASGMNRVVFLVSTNRGVPPAPIHKVASGGELARFMLALKMNLARAEKIETLVFDEVDTGISGVTADAVGRRLRQLAADVQVLVVTHSPQVAAYGAHHYTVSKTDKKGSVITHARRLADDERRDELARILSGGALTETAKNMAKELMGKA